MWSCKTCACSEDCAVQLMPQHSLQHAQLWRAGKFPRTPRDNLLRYKVPAWGVAKVVTHSEIPSTHRKEYTRESSKLPEKAIKKNQVYRKPLNVNPQQNNPRTWNTSTWAQWSFKTWISAELSPISSRTFFQSPMQPPQALHSSPPNVW